MSAGLSYFCLHRVYAFCLFSPIFFSRATSSVGFQESAREQQQPPSHPQPPPHRSEMLELRSEAMTTGGGITGATAKRPL